jgi:hypothetical protein
LEMSLSNMDTRNRAEAGNRDVTYSSLRMTI